MFIKMQANSAISFQIVQTHTSNSFYMTFKKNICGEESKESFVEFFLFHRPSLVTACYARIICNLPYHKRSTVGVVALK